MEKKIQDFQNLLEEAKRTGDKTKEVDAYGRLAYCYKFVGRFQEAVEHAKMELDITKQLGNKTAEGKAYEHIGLCLRSVGNYDEAIKCHQAEFNIAKKLENKAAIGMACCNLGLCYQRLGKYDEAFKHKKMHLDIASDLNDRRSEVIAHGNLGCCYQALCEFEKALEHHRTSLNMAVQVGDETLEGKAHQNLGNCYQSTHKYDEALKHHKMHLEIARTLGDKPGEGEAYCNIGLCYASKEEHEEGLKYQKLHLEIVQELGDKSGEGVGHCGLGKCYTSLQEYSKALECYKRSLEIARQLKEKDNEAMAYKELSCCSHRIQRFKDAESYGRKSLECYEELFDHTPEEDRLKVSFREAFESVLIVVIRSLLSQEKKDEALVIAEMGRARALAFLMLKNYPCRLNAPEHLELHQIREVVEALGSTVVYFTFDQLKIGVWVIQPTGDVTFEEIAIEARSSQDEKTASTDFACYVLGSLVRDATMQLRPTSKCEDRTLSCLYEDEVQRETRKELGKSTGSASTATFPDVTEGKMPTKTGKLSQEEREPLEELYQTVLGPVRQLVEGHRVVIVPDGPLPLVPFSALVDENGHYVAQSLRISLMPSLAIAKMITAFATPSEGPSASCLIVGDPRIPIFELEGRSIRMNKLPCAEAEARMIGEVLNVEALVGERATKETFLQRARTADLIHIAAHGDMRRGEILLAPSPRTPNEKIFTKEDVMLTISNLEEIRLTAKLVILNCCHSAQGEVKAEGVIGIARAFLGAGARSVLVSLWAVDDAAALWFMEQFYKQLAGGAQVSEALNCTMSAMRSHKVYWHPHYWAPYVLIGDDVTPFAGNR